MDWDLLNQQIPWIAMGVIVFVVCMIGLDMSRAFVRMHSVYAVRKCSVALFGYLDLGTNTDTHADQVQWQLATAS